MARIRYVKPDFFSDEEASDLSRDARLFYIGLWCQLDRQGLIEERAKFLRKEIFGYDDDITIKRVEEFIDELVNGRFLIRVQHAGVKYLWCPTFGKHQKFHPEEENKLEVPFELLVDGYKQAFGKLPDNADEYKKIFGRLPGGCQQPSDRAGTGTGTGTLTGTGNGTLTGTPATDEQGLCEAEWIETLRHFGIERISGCSDLEREEIRKALKAHKYSGTIHALYGIRFEPKGKDGYNPADHINITRVFEPKKINKWQNLAVKHKSKRAHEVPPGGQATDQVPHLNQ